MGQLDIEQYMQDNPHFDGDDYKKSRDEKRLRGQILRVFNCVKDGEWKEFHDNGKTTVSYTHLTLPTKRIV